MNLKCGQMIQVHQSHFLHNWTVVPRNPDSSNTHFIPAFPQDTHHLGFTTQSILLFNSTGCFHSPWQCILHPSLIRSLKEQIFLLLLDTLCASALPRAYLTVPSIIKLIGVADLCSSAAEMAPLVAINDKLTDSMGFNPNYTWLTRAKI